MAAKVTNIDLLAFVSMATKRYINTKLKFIDAFLQHSLKYNVKNESKHEKT